VKLHAMADVVEGKLKLSHSALTKRFAERIDVPEDRQFLGFDAYKKAIDTLRPGDVAMCTTHSYCRPMHVEYAVSKGIHVFMEKSFASDPLGTHRILKAAQEADKKGVKIACGLMCRHSVNRQMLIDKIRAGELGEIPLIRAYRMDGGSQLGPRDRSKHADEVEYQIRRAINFPWVSSGRMIDYIIHQIDEACWIKDSWPVSVQAMGGRAPGSTDCSQNLDVYAMEFTFADGTRAMVDYRGMPGCQSDFVTYIHGTKRAAQFSGNVHKGDVHTYKDQRCTGDNIDWKPPGEKFDPWDSEWNVLMQKIRRDEPHNEGVRAAYTNYAAIMGRAATHSGKVVTWDEVTKSQFTYAPNMDAIAFGGEAPVHDDEQGRYPVPVPGKHTEI
jgi:predicted dehydrogenase